MRAIVSPDEMYAIEKEAVECGKTSVDDLIEHVGRKASEIVESVASTMAKKPRIVVLAGKGNNGADAYTTGVYLLKNGFQVIACQVEPDLPNTQLSGRRNRFLSDGGREVLLDALDTVCGASEPCIIIDGIYGIGMKGVPSQRARTAIQWANCTQMQTIALDIPSGVDPHSGEVLIDAIRADVTVACHLPKRGYFFRDGRNCVGKIECIDLGLREKGTDLFLLEEKDVLPLLPEYDVQQDKFSRGSALLIGGSSGLMGACALSCLACLSSGVGYLQAAVREDAWAEIAALPLEAVKRKVPKNPSSFFDTLVSTVRTIMVGPGLGRDEEAGRIFQEFWKFPTTIPKVIDADALFWLSQTEIVPNCLKNAIITPHRREAERLIGSHSTKSLSLMDEGLIHAIQNRVLNSSVGSVCILKGAPTFIFQGGEKRVYVMAEGNPGMATLGSGDVLTGIVGALLAQGLLPIEAAFLGTWLHAEAAHEAASRVSSYSLYASKIIEGLPLAFRALLQRRTDGALRHYVPSCRAKASCIEDYL